MSYQRILPRAFFVISIISIGISASADAQNEPKRKLPRIKKNIEENKGALKKDCKAKFGEVAKDSLLAEAFCDPRPRIPQRDNIGWGERGRIGDGGSGLN